MVHIDSCNKEMYYISNYQDTIFIRLSSQGAAETCTKNQRKLFTYQKACNILKGLPRKLVKFNFSVKQLEEQAETEVNNTTETSQSLQQVQEDSEVIIKEYEENEKVTEWSNRIDNMSTLVHDAIHRQEFLKQQLSEYDRAISNCQHRIELLKNMDMYKGYLEYKILREILRNRRKIKNELEIINVIIGAKNINNSYEMFKINEDKETVINALKNKKFTVRKTNIQEF